jgi:hypothetical protein
LNGMTNQCTRKLNLMLRFTKKSYDIVGYVADANTWCVDCTKEKYGDDKLGAEPKFDSAHNVVAPIFADSESDTPSSCANCGVYIDENLTSEGVEYAFNMIKEAYDKNRKTDFLMALAESMAWMHLGEDDKNRHQLIRRYLGEI